jgi:hypothetical protein
MNDFDQGGRFEVKYAPHAHVGWLFPRASKVIRWSRWLDSQSAPRPGEPDRRCDTIAELVHREKLAPPSVLVIELFTEPDAEALDRTGEYLWRFRRELRHGPHERDKYTFTAALIFLTGFCAEKVVKAALPDEDEVANVLAPRVLELASLDADAFLNDVEQGRLPPALLPWVPLMKGSQKKETAERWLRLSLRLDEMDRRTAADLACTFSDLTNSRPIWGPVLEAVTMQESTFLREVRAETRREDLTRLLRMKLQGDTLAVALARVEKQEDPAVLLRWFDQALTASPEAILAEFGK